VELNPLYTNKPYHAFVAKRGQEHHFLPFQLFRWHAIGVGLLRRDESCWGEKWRIVNSCRFLQPLSRELDTRFPFFWPSFSIVQLKLDREYDSISTIIGPKTSSSHMMRETCEFEMEMSRKA
jgi:hypothetical protein